jgi:nucleotide-binding universal stress UspA family protein
MAKRVLVPLDGSPQSEDALRYAFIEHPGATLVLLHVIDPTRAGYGAQAGIPSYSEEWFEEEKEEATELFERGRELAAEAGFEGDVESHFEVGQPARVIVDFTGKHDVDHVVMGSHGRKGVSRILLGSVTESVVRNSRVPVTVTR